MQEHHCFRHPETRTRRKCYRCGRAICSVCVLHASHHFFCGRKCQLQHAAIHAIRKAGKRIGRMASPLVGVSHRYKFVLSIFLFAGVVSICALNIALLQKVQVLAHELAAVEDRLNLVVEKQLELQRAVAVERPDHANLEAHLKILHPAENTVTQNTAIEVIGEVAGDHVVVLNKRGKPLRATIPEDGRFAFNKVRLEHGRNEYEISALPLQIDNAEKAKVRVTLENPELDLLSRSFDRGTRDVRAVALTFDAGSTDNAAEPILRILDEFGLKATMFLTGQFIKKYPETTRKIADMGHEIGNHTWNHPHLTSYATDGAQSTLTSVTRETIQHQLQETASLFQQITGRRMTPYWRAPYGEHNRQIRLWAAELGYRHIGWTNGHNWLESLDTMDWVADTASQAYHNSEEVLLKVVSLADRDDGFGAAGGIILMHLGSERDADHVYYILPNLIRALQARHYKFVTISELIRLVSPQKS